MMEAINLLGVTTIKTLALYTEIFSAFDLNKEIPFSIDELWIHSIKTAKNAKEIIRLKTNSQKIAG